MNAPTYADLIAEAEDSLEYWVDIPVTDFTRDLIRLMEMERVSRAELARRIDSSRAYITKVLRGNANFTLATMAKLARALNGVVHVHVAPRSAVTQWFDMADGGRVAAPVLGEDVAVDAVAIDPRRILRQTEAGVLDQRTTSQQRKGSRTPLGSIRVPGLLEANGEVTC